MKKILFSLTAIIFIFLLTSCGKEFNVYFYADGQLIDTKIVKYKDEIELIDAPIKHYYNFVEWRYENGQKYNGEKMPKNDLKLFAYYVEDENLEKIVINLEDGRKIYVDLYSDVAPISVENFLKLVDANYYDGVIFHRVIKDFMIQTGGFAISNNTIVGKPQLTPIVGEFIANGYQNNLKHEAGVISMARSTDMNSATSQFFICSADSPHLDGQYAAFGRVSDAESLKVVMDISNVRTGYLNQMFANFPVNPIVIASIERA